MDGWFLDDLSSGSSSSTVHSLFDAYGADNSSINSVLVNKEEDDYLQQQVCMDMDHIFSEELFAPQTNLAEMFPMEQWQPSSSSSSQRLANRTGTVVAASHRISKPACEQQFFPTPTSDDIAITTAMLAILSTPGSTAPSSIQSLQHGRCGFRPYDPAVVAPACESTKTTCGQKMIKSSISILRGIELARDCGGDAPPPSSNQLHHVMSERKRREKLNGSFHTLRMLLPPGSKKDKASVLHKTKDYLKILKTQISELEAKNRALEEHVSPIDDTKEGTILDGESTERVRVQVSEAGQDVIGLQITVAVECDLVELALCALECLKGMSVDRLVSMDAKYCSRRLHRVTWIKLKFDIKDSDWDEVTFKEAMMRAVEVIVATTVEETVEEISDEQHFM